MTTRRVSGGASSTGPGLSRGLRVVATFGGAAIILGIGVVVQIARDRGVEARRLVDHTHDVMRAATSARIALLDAETGQRGYIITGDSSYLAPHDSAIASLSAELGRLRALSRDNPVQQHRLDTLAYFVDGRLAELARDRELRRTQGAEAAAAGIRTNRGRELTSSIARLISAMEAEERRLLALRERAADRWRGFITLALVAGTLLSALIAIFVNGLLTRFAAVQEENARVLTAQNDQLHEQGLELEMQHQRVQDQAAELELQNEQLQLQAVELEAQSEEASRAQVAAELANSAKSEFLAAMSHELRTPLNAIAGYADLMSMGVRGPISEAQLEDIRRIKKSSLHLLSLINEILNLARIESGHVELHMGIVPAQPLLDDVAVLVAPQMQAKGLTCTVEPGDPALAVYTDIEKARQILLNLLTNACKFTERGGRVTIVCAREDANAELVSIKVTDSGRGIPPEKLAAIFEPFVQVDRRLTPEPDQGLGLGLAISRDLARAMSGDITVESVVGEGATFTLTLPAAALHGAELGGRDHRRIADAIS